MKIVIHTALRDRAWGGGNQFLKVLKKNLESRGVYGEATSADVSIFNSYQDLVALIQSFFFHTGIKRVYRLGPIFSLHRKGWKWRLIDRVMIFCANFFASSVVFQSKWSYEEACRRGFAVSKPSAVIHNAVDGTIFYPKSRSLIAGAKIRLIYTSWSTNNNKGFEYLQYLDTHLDFEKYEMTFIGNTPTDYKNIKICAPLESAKLADQLRVHDIFISPTKDDACSNAILEALACGLPVVALNSGANRELVKDGGELYMDEASLLYAIDRVAQNQAYYTSRISIETIEQVTDRYLALIRGSIT
jgi:glycosyltransferase involved in cell wall biosynthesis